MINILISINILMMYLLNVYLYKRVRLIEELLQDVSIDISLYEKIKLQARMEQNKKIDKKINKVGNWKK